MKKKSVKEMAAELKSFISAQEEDYFISAAAPTAAAGFSRGKEKSRTPEISANSTGETAPLSKPALTAAPSAGQDRLTVVFGKPAVAEAQPVSVNPPLAAVSQPEPEPAPVANLSAGVMTTEEKRAALAQLAETIKHCNRCPLGSTRLNAVPGEGNVDARLMFIGEGPGYDEDRQGRPFVGRAGQLLDKMIIAMGLKREDVFIANIAKCHPMVDPQNPDKHGNDRAPNAGEIASCRKYLEKQISIILPEYIIALGGVSAKALIADAKSLSALRGRFYNLSLDSVSLARPVKILATFHPAALLRNPGWKKDAWADLQLVMHEMGLKSPSK